jgi:hypothetical protein
MRFKRHVEQPVRGAVVGMQVDLDTTVSERAHNPVHNVCLNQQISGALVNRDGRL